MTACTFKSAINPYLILSVMLLFLLSIGLQAYLPVHWDMLYILDAGQRLAKHGTLLHDVVDPNPPLIFYITAWLQAIIQPLGLSSVWAFKGLHYVIILYALTASYGLLPTKHRDALFFTLACCLLLLPATAFAEREHTMIALTLPYFFLLYQRAEHHDSNAVAKVCISLLAGIGLCLKPYFFLGIISVELLVLGWKRDWHWLIRLETGVLLLPMLIYVVLLAIMIPDYYSTLLPLVLHWYAFNHSVVFVLKHEAFLSFMVLVCCFIVNYRRVSRVEWLLFAAGVGFALSFVMQGKGWFYHAIPLFTITMLMTIEFVYERHHGWWFLLCMQCALMIFPVSMMYYRQMHCHIHATCYHQPLVDVVTQHARHQSIFFFSTLMSETIPVTYYAPAENASRFPFMWVLSGVLNRQHMMHGLCDPLCEQGKSYVRESINDDLHHHQPKLIFIDVNASKAYLPSHFNYLSFMKQSSSFHHIWRHYHYLTSAGHYDVYIRDSSH